MGATHGMIYAISEQADFASVPPDLHQALALLLVDGHRDTEAISAASPFAAEHAAVVLAELAELRFVEESKAPGEAHADAGTSGIWVNPRSKKSKSDDEPHWLKYGIFDADLKHPPQQVLDAVPVLAGDIDPSQITGDANEYYLLSRVDGISTVENLQSMTAMAMPVLLRRLVKHYCYGTIAFPPDFVRSWLGVKNGGAGPADAADAADAAEAAGDDSAARPAGHAPYSRILQRLSEDPALLGPLRRTMAELAPGAMSQEDLSQKECLVLSLMSGDATIGELLDRAPGAPKDITLTVLGLYRRGVVLLAPPERAGPPVIRAPAAPAAAQAPDDEPEEDDDDVYEVDYTTGEFALEGDDPEEGDDEVYEVDYTTGEFTLEGLDERPGGGEAAKVARMVAELDGLQMPGADDTDPERRPAITGPAEAPPGHEPTRPKDGPLARGGAASTAAEDSGEAWGVPAILLRGKEDPDVDAKWTAPPAAGDLAEHGFSLLFDAIVSNRHTGILHIRQGTDLRNVWFDHGVPVHATSDVTEDRLGSLLWRAGSIDKQDYIRLDKAIRSQPDKSEAELLDGMDLLVPDEIQAARRLQLVHIAARLFHATRGQYRFFGKLRLQSDLETFAIDLDDVRAMVPTVAPRAVTAIPEMRDDSGPQPVVVVAQETVDATEAAPSPEPAPPVEKRTPPAQPSDWVREHMDQYVVVPIERTGAVAALRLGEKERRFAEALGENRHRLREALAMSSLGRTKTFHFLAALWAECLVDLVDEVDQEDEALRNLDTLNKWLVRIETGDRFFAVGCHPSAAGAEIERTYRKAKSRFDPARFDDRDEAFLASLERVNYVMDRAYALVRDATKRRAYRLEEFGETRLLGFAEVQEKKADVYFFFKQAWVTARDLYESAWDLVPDNAIFMAHMGYCHFRATTPIKKKMAQGVAIVERAVRLAPTVPKVLLIAALLEKDRGNVARQKDYINRAQKIVGTGDALRKLLVSYKLV